MTITNDTIILRFADHGEGGLSHGMREKAYTAYEEMIHIPLIVHNPKLYPEPLETNAFYDHLDLLPTILDLAGVPDPESYGIGRSIVPVIRDPSQSVQDHTIFSYDDVFFLPPGASGTAKTQQGLDSERNASGNDRHSSARSSVAPRQDGSEPSAASRTVEV